MRLREEQIAKMAKLIGHSLQQKQLIEARVSMETIIAKIGEVITKDLLDEENLEADARKMMEQYRSQIDSGQLDERKMFLMIKKQLAKERNFIL